MSEILVNEIKHRNGTSAITINTSAQMTVRSEGGNATTNLQQGLAKVWINWDGQGASINDSFNISSVSDLGVGIYQANYSNAMANTIYELQSHDHSYGNGWSDSLTTTSYQTRRRNESAAYYDVSRVWGLIHGDLA